MRLFACSTAALAAGAAIFAATAGADRAATPVATGCPAGYSLFVGRNTAIWGAGFPRQPCQRRQRRRPGLRARVPERGTRCFLRERPRRLLAGVTRPAALQLHRGQQPGGRSDWGSPRPRQLNTTVRGSLANSLGTASHVRDTTLLRERSG